MKTADRALCAGAAQGNDMLNMMRYARQFAYLSAHLLNAKHLVTMH